MGQAEEGMHLVETVDDVERLQVRNPDMLAFVSQTTLSVDDTTDVIAALKRKYPNIAEPKKADICYATTNRQEAVKFMAPQVEVVIVVGSPNSSNSNRLREVAEKKGTHAYMVDNAAQIDPAWLQGKSRIGVTAGASAPEILVQAVIDRLKECGAKSVRTLEGVEEHVTFRSARSAEAGWVASQLTARPPSFCMVAAVAPDLRMTGVRRHAHFHPRVLITRLPVRAALLQRDLRFIHPRQQSSD